jgi:hypothetical protein
VYWFWVACAVVVGLIAGFLFCVRVLRPSLQELSRNSAQDRDFVLRVLRRELANWMLRRDPDRYLLIYKEAHDTAVAISAADRSDQRAQLAKLCEPMWGAGNLLTGAALMLGRVLINRVY